MKKIIVAIAIVAVGFSSCKNEKKEKVETKEAVEIKEAPKKEGNVNITTSVLAWKGTKPTGAHNGTVAISTGSLNIENDKVTGGEFLINMKSIKCLDIPVTEKGNKDLVGHLNGADFFDIAKFPTAKFVIASLKENGEKIEVTGNLTIKEVTKSITFPATITKVAETTTLTSDAFKIDRTQFGITYKSKTIDAALKDKFIDDLIEFTIKIDAKK